MEKLRLLPICCLIAVMFIAAIHAANCQDDRGPHSPKSIMIYILSDRSDNSHWYKDPADLNPLKEVLEDRGYSVDVEDKLTLPTISINDMRSYQEIWILEGDWDDKVDVTEKEALDLRQYYEMGRGIWLSFETTYPPDDTYGSWNEDALVFARNFGIDWASYEIGKPGGRPVFSDHPIFHGVLLISFDDATGCLCSKNSSIEVLWNYSPSCQGVAVLDGRNKGEGRAVFDSGWVLGYTYLNKNDDLLFAGNVADWLLPSNGGTQHVAGNDPVVLME